MKTTTVHVNLDFDMEVSHEDISNMLLLRGVMRTQPETAAVTQAIDEDIGIGGEPAASVPNRSEPVEVAPSRAPPPAAKKAAPKPAPIAKVAAPPPPKVPLEADLRAILKRVNAIHPKSTAGVVDLLKEHGGANRLTDCDPATTWPAIEAAALAYLAEHAEVSD